MVQQCENLLQGLNIKISRQQYCSKRLVKDLPYRIQLANERWKESNKRQRLPEISWNIVTNFPGAILIKNFLAVLSVKDLRPMLPVGVLGRYSYSYK